MRSWRGRSSRGPAPCGSRAPGTRSAAASSPTGRCSRSTQLAPRARRRRRARARARRGRDPPARASRASCTPAAWRCRTSATSTPSRWPARSRPARTAPARGSRTSPGRSRGRARARRRQRARRSTTATSCKAARVSLGALGVIAAVTLRCVPAFRLHDVDQPEPLEDVLADLQERADAHDHFEFWTFPHADVALTRTHDRTEAPPQRRPAALAPTCSDVADGQPRLPRRQRRRPALPAHDPAPEPLRVRGRLAARADRLVLRDLRHRAARALRGDGVRAAARARGRGRARGRARRSSATRSRSRSSCASPPATTRCSHPRTAATARSSRCTCSAAWRTSRRSARSRRRCSRSAAARTGASARSCSAAELAPRYPRWDDFQARRARGSTPAAASPTRGCETCWDDAMKTFNIFDADVRVRRRRTLTATTPAWIASGRRSARTRIGAHGLRAAARAVAVPVPLRVRRGMGARPRGRADGPPSRGRGRARGPAT